MSRPFIPAVRVLRRVVVTLAALTLLLVIAYFALKLPPSPSVEHLRGLAISHRGERATAPENTLEAIRLAHSLVAKVVEIDVVAASRDGVPVLMHDCTVDRMTHGEGNNENPSWSPDGRYLVFASNRAGSYDIYTIPADGGTPRRLTRNGNCFTPDWSR